MRCPHRCLKDPIYLLIGRYDKTPIEVQCRLDEGHDGPHHAWYQPFPGFADQHMRWSDDA